MVSMLINAAFLLAVPLALAGFACYVCRGRPVALRSAKRRASEYRALQEIEWYLRAEAEGAESDNSRQID
jgi:hypothetical protein